MKTTIKYILFFLLYFGIHYFEGLPPIGSLSVAQAWKLPLILLLIIYCFVSKKKKQPFVKTSFILAFLMLFNIDFLIFPTATIAGATKILPLALFFQYFSEQFGQKMQKLENILFVFAQFIAITSLITLLGIVQPLYEYGIAIQFGIDDMEYYSSLFYAPHCASSYFAVSTIVLVYGFLQKRFKTFISKLFNATLIVILLISIFKAFVRTGWLMLIVGISVLIFSQTKLSLKQFVLSIIVFGILTGGVVYLYNTNEAIHARINGVNMYDDNSGENIDVDGSGRIEFWKNGFDLWTRSDNIFELLFGQGFTKVAENNEHFTGLRVVSHNQFIDSLSQHGLICYILLILFYIQLYRYIRKFTSHQYYKLSLSIFWMTIIFAFFQNEMYFDYAILFAIVLSLLNIEKTKIIMVPNT